MDPNVPVVDRYSYTYSHSTQIGNDQIIEIVEHSILPNDGVTCIDILTNERGSTHDLVEVINVIRNTAFMIG